MVDEDRTAQAQVLRLAPQAVGVHLGAGSGVDDEHGRLACLHGSQGVAGEVGLAGSVDQVDFVRTILNGSNGGADGKAAADFLGVVVQVGLAVMRGAQAIGATRDVQHGLGERGLAGTVLAHEGDIPYMLGLGCSHKSPSFREVRGASPLCRKCVYANAQ